MCVCQVCTRRGEEWEAEGETGCRNCWAAAELARRNGDPFTGMEEESIPESAAKLAPFTTFAELTLNKAAA